MQFPRDNCKVVNLKKKNKPQNNMGELTKHECEGKREVGVVEKAS